MALQNYGLQWLLDQTYRVESIATSSQTFDDDDVIQFLNMELQGTVIPIIQSVNEEFGVMYVDYALTGEARIRIPSQATGLRLRNVQYVNANGIISNVPRLSPDKLGQIGYSQTLGFYIQNNELVWYPQAPTQNGSVRLAYFRRPNTLVPVLQTGRVIVVDTLTNTVTLDNDPTNTEWDDADATVDVLIGTAPFDFRLQDSVIVSRTGPDITLNDVSTIEVGDYVALAGMSPVAQFVPVEATYLLAQLAAQRCLQALGDTEGYKVAAAKIAEMRSHLINLISDRIVGQPKRISALGLARRADLGWWYNL